MIIIDILYLYIYNIYIYILRYLFIYIAVIWEGFIRLRVWGLGVYTRLFSLLPSKDEARIAGYLYKVLDLRLGNYLGFGVAASDFREEGFRGLCFRCLVFWVFLFCFRILRLRFGVQYQLGCCAPQEQHRVVWFNYNL